MRNKIPPEAFDYYTSLGPGRTYAAVAAHYGVSVRGVTKRAIKEDWQGRLRRVEEQARQKTEAKAVEDLASIDERHLRTTRAIQARALEALKNMPINSGMSAVRALDVSVKLERAILGRGKEAPAAATHAALAAAAAAIPKEAVDAAREVMRKLEAEKKPAASAPPQPEPVVPPVLAPLRFGQN